jgi:WD40 repeat protein
MIRFRHELLQYNNTFDLGELPESKILSPDGRWLITGSRKGGTVKIWDVQTGQIQRSWVAVPLSPYPYINENSPGYDIAALGITPDGKTLATGGKALKTWDFETGKQVRAFKGFGSWVSYISISTDGKVLVTNGTAGPLREAWNIWHLDTGKKIRRSLFQQGRLVSPDTEMVVGFDMNDYGKPPAPIKVWSLATGEWLYSLDNSHAIRPKTFVFSPDGSLLAGGGANGIKIWDFATGEQVQRIQKDKNIRFHEHLDNVSNFVFSPDGKFLLSSGSDGLVQIWSVETGQNAGTLQGENEIGWIAISHDGHIVIGSKRNKQDSQAISVWSILLQ